MRRRFKIEKIENPEFFTELIGDNVFVHNNPIIKKFKDYCLILEDFRTVIELNKITEDLLSKKYLFYKYCIQEVAEKTFKNSNSEELQDDIETNNTLLVQALFTTVIVTYAKWFTNSSGSKKPKLEIRDVFKNVTPQTLKTHKLIMEYRHSYFAHSGSTSYEEVYPIYLQDPN